MPYLHCSKCHHEYESAERTEPCPWCGAPAGQVLEEQTPLERFVKEYLGNEEDNGTGSSGLR